MMCNMDCFHCPYPDCTNNSMETKKEKAMRVETENKSRQLRWYYANREKVLARQKEYNDAHKEERSAYHKKYYEKNREKLIASESERIKQKRANDKEWAKRENAKAKERYWRKKLENHNSD